MSKMTVRACMAAGVSLIAGSIGSAAHAGAFYLQEQSVKGAGRAFSGEVADKGPESLWWNPAAIGGMTGGAAYVGASAILPKGDVTNINTRIIRPGQAPAAVGGQQVSEDPINKGVVPSGAIAYGITPELAVGVAVTAPYNFTTNYDSNSWARYTADKSHLRTIDVQPSIAFTPTPGLSIGAALNIEHTKASLSNSLPNLSPLLADGHQTLKGDGWDLGWSAGAQFTSGGFTLGGSYKSSIKHKLGGTVTTAGLLGPLAAQNRVIDTDATFRTPWQATVGARMAVTPALTLNAQVVRLGWGKFDAIRLGAPINTAIPENYRNTWSLAGGVDYMVSPQWTLRAGVQHDQTPTRDGERDARVPDADRWNFAAGTSYQMSKAIAIDAAVNYIHFKDATIDRTTAAYAGTAAQTPILVSGELNKASAWVFSLGARASF